MSWVTIVLIILVILFLASVPVWPYSTGWGYWPGGLLGLLLVILLVLWLAGVIA